MKRCGLKKNPNSEIEELGGEHKKGIIVGTVY